MLAATAVVILLLVGSLSASSAFVPDYITNYDLMPLSMRSPLPENYATLYTRAGTDSNFRE